MMQSKSLPRYAALIAGVLVASSCDTRLPTQVSGADDVERPVVTFSAAGAVNNAVSLAAPVVVTVKVSDNIGVSTLLTTVRNGATVIATDTATFKPVTASTSRAVTVPLTNAKKGDRIVVRTTVSDAALNTRTDSLVLTIAAPSITLLTPAVGAKLNVGDSLLVTARVQDGAGLKSITFSGYSLRGNAALGTQDTVRRYPAVTAPGTGSFAVGVVDTTITRYLKSLIPADSVTDSLVVIAVAVDALGGIDTARVSVKIVRGPSVQVLSPVPGDSATPGAGLTVTLRATDLTGVARLGFRIVSDASFPTKVDTTVIASYGTLPKDVTFSATIQVPANAPPKALLTITPISTNSGGQDGASAPTVIAVRAGLPPAPRVYQNIAPRVETSDSITITAIGNGVTFVGYALRDSAGGVIKRDSIAQTQPYPSTAVVQVPLNLPSSAQGKRITLISFAYDQGGRIGYSLPASATTFQGSAANAFVDSSLVVFGHTFALPAARRGVIADVTVDQARGNVFLSNLNFNLLEVFQGAASAFAPAGIAVGAQPWGMTVARTGARDTLFVANSGGTNLSRVFIGSASPAAMREDLSKRILTRVSFMYKVTEVRDMATGKIRITVSAPISFSDRPQYVEESTGGRLYVSTRPTTAAPKGTIRFLDPSAPAPDFRFILDFANIGNDPNSFLIANVDSMGVAPAPAASPFNDVLVICDHPTGTVTPSSCGSSSKGVDSTIAALRLLVPTTDLEARVNADEATLGLTDTTFAASSASGNWIAFGEGNRAPFARAFVLNDQNPAASRYQYVSPNISIGDLVNNASDRLFGLALTDSTLGVHGSETYFATLRAPFTQRLQGKVSTFGTGAGVAFHPQALGITTPQDKRLAFVASANGSIEVVDIAYYFNRARLATKTNLYGPLRASLPFPSDDPSVVLKLFGLSTNGLVVINLTAADIAAGP